MFANTPFNQPIGDWNVRQVRSMNGMFSNARQFNQDISGWDISNVENFNDMFWSAQSFYQDLSSWTIKQFTQTRHMFIECPLDRHVDMRPRVEGTSSRVNEPFYKPNK
jgi:surface protein